MYRIKVFAFQIVILLLLLFFQRVEAQQDPQYTQYMYDAYNVNPAYANHDADFSVFALHRTQWVGVDGAPRTNLISLHKNVEVNKIGYGISFTNDQAGVTKENNIAVDLGYSFRISQNYNLSFGMKLSTSFMEIDFHKLNIKHPQDQLIVGQNNQLNPNVGFGLFWYSEKSYVGFSIPYLFQNNHFDQELKSTATESMHYYLTSGIVLNITDQILLKPAIMAKAVQAAPLQVDLSLNSMWYDKVIVGAAYRVNASMSYMAGFQIAQSWMLGYAYDLETTAMENYNSGSHEIFLKYQFSKKSNKLISPRFF